MMVFYQFFHADVADGGIRVNLTADTSIVASLVRQSNTRLGGFVLHEIEPRKSPSFTHV